MGVFSKFHRYHETGEGPNVNNVTAFGTPHHSLYTSAKILTFQKQIDITDEAGRLVYQSRSKFLSFLNKTDILRADGSKAAHMERKLISFHETHFVTMYKDGTQFRMSTELLHLIKEVINIDSLNWQLRGNITELNFEIYDQNDQVVAVIGQKMFSLHDKFCIDIYQPDKEETAIAILITLQHILRDREEAHHSNTSILWD